MAAMGPTTGLRLSVDQRMALEPRLLQSILLLQLPSVELEDWLVQAAEENPALTLDRPPESAGSVAERPTGAERASGEAAAEAHEALLRNAPAPERDLAALVEEQLALLDWEPDLSAWVRFLVGQLDPAGFLSPSDEELLAGAAEVGLEGGMPLLARAIGALQTLDPKGLGARDAIEAMLMQLDHESADYALLCRLLEDFVEDLASNRMPHVASRLGICVDELRGLIAQLAELDPRPAASLVAPSAPEWRPDVVVEAGEDGFEVRVERSALPTVGVDPEVSAIARDRDLPAEVRQYLRGQMEEARSIVDAVRLRGVTLLRVTRSVFAHQLGFLEEGPKALQPLAMGAVAAELELALSTVSRAVGGKAVQTPWGVFPLRHFFQGEAGGASQEGVRLALDELVKGEDPAAPLSDDELVSALEGRGIGIARRTVAKYRKELGIPSSYRRRRY